MLEDLKKELEALIEAKSPEGFEKAMEEMANKIHPDATKIAGLVSSLKSLKDVNEVIVLSDGLSERLCNMEIDLYALIKDINKEKEKANL